MAPNGNGKLMNRCMILMFSLLAAGIVGLVVMYRGVGIAQDNIKTLKREQELQEVATRLGLDKIDKKLEAIAKSINVQAIEAAKFHHDHPK